MSNKGNPPTLIIELLKKVQRNFPDNLWLWVAGGQMYLMKKGKNGEHVTTKSGGVDPNYIIEEFRIEIDGGSW